MFVGGVGCVLCVVWVCVWLVGYVGSVGEVVCAHVYVVCDVHVCWGRGACTCGGQRRPCPSLAFCLIPLRIVSFAEPGTH